MFTGETSHKQYVFGEMTTRGIINGSDHFGIRSVRSEQFKYIWNFTPEVEFSNACTKSKEFQSWIALAEAGNDHAATLVKRYVSRPQIELYDIEKDPLELNNLAELAGYDAVKSDLRAELDRWMLACGDRGQITEMQALEHMGKGKTEESADSGAKTKKKKGKNKKTKPGI